MAQQTINIGASPNDGTGTPLRTAFQYTNSNFSELYTAVGPSGNNIVVPGNATITGDLTVATNRFAVSASGVGIGTTTMTYNLNVTGAAPTVTGIKLINTSGTSSNLCMFSAGSAYSSFGVPNNAGWLAVEGSNPLAIGPTGNGGIVFVNNGSEAMRLNSTGLGVGGSPVSGNKLFVEGSAQIGSSSTTGTNRLTIDGLGTVGNVPTIRFRSAGAAKAYVGLSGAYLGDTSTDLLLTTDAAGASVKFGSSDTGTVKMTLDSSGNVGIGVTPSAWRSTNKAVQVGSYSSLTSSSAGDLQLFNNAYINSGGANIYQSNGFATRYEQYQGVHAWYTAPSGTAGNTATFTQAMTLDASGNLLVGTTSQNGSWNTKLTLSNDSGTTKWAVGPYLGGVTNFLISAGASAGVYLNGTAATSWTSASDERLKDIIEPISNAIAKVGSLRAVIGKFKFDENNTRKPFLIAQDIQAVLPEAVDASNPEKLGVAYTDVIPLLVAAIKELTAEVNALKNA